MEGKGGLRIDTLDAGDFKAEFHGGSGEGTEHCAACTVDVDRDIETCFCLIFIQDIGDLRNRFVMAGVCRSENHIDS